LGASTGLRGPDAPATAGETPALLCGCAALGAVLLVAFRVMLRKTLGFRYY
jgi:hypothetical protein